MKSMQMIVQILTDIRTLLMEMKNKNQIETRPLMDTPLFFKDEVLDKLKMSESTYGRNIRVGLLQPMRLSGVDMYYEEDLRAAMEESRRKGRT